MQSRKHTPSVQSDEFDATGQMGVAPGAPGVGHPFGAAHLQGTLGNSCLAERLAQMSTSSRAEKGQWPATAGRPAGTSGYPFMAQIASSFGAEHDLSDIETEVGTGKARAGAQSLGSDA